MVGREDRRTGRVPFNEMRNTVDFVEVLQKIGGRFSLADGLVLLLAIVTLWGVHKAPQGEFFDDPLNRKQGLALRGVFAGVVVLHNLTLRGLEGGFLFPRLVFWGGLAVSVFFMLSGYGLMMQTCHSKKYVREFWAKRLSALGWPYLIITVLSFLQCHRSDFSMMGRFNVSWTFIYHGWFFSVLLLFYLVFWLSNRRDGQGKWERIAVTCAGVLLITSLQIQTKRNAWHYYSNGAFIVGLLLGAYQEKALKLLREQWHKIVALVMLILVLHLSCGLADCCIGPMQSVLSRFIMHGFWCLGIVALSMKWQLGNRVLRWLGTISYELYLVHGWVQVEVRHWWPEWTGSMYVWTVVGASLTMAWVLHEGVEWWKRLGRAGGRFMRGRE